MPDTTKSTSASPPLTSSNGFPPENPDGSPALVGPDDYTRQLIRARADKPGGQAVVGGNYADLQRLGAEAANGNDGNGAFQAGPGVDLSSDRYVTASQAESARGEWTRETERTGLLDAPAAVDPAENKEPDSVDPGSVSPTVAGSKSAPASPQAKS